MSYKTILVCLTNTHNAERLSRLSVNIARKFGAHLIGLHTIKAIDVYPGITLPISAQYEREFGEQQIKEAKTIEEIFRRETSGDDIVTEWRCVEAGSDEAADRIVEHARCADLVVLSQPDKEHDRADQTTIQRRVIETSGRPVLVVPIYGDFQEVGNNILACWSATREAARSFHDAIPFMQQGKDTNIFWVSTTNPDETYLAQSANEIATVLDRYGVKAEVTHRVHTGLPIVDEILNHASDSGTDLIVSGAYGHSRIYDFMVGATTTHLMKHMTVPVLFSC